ncbi:SDR family NAD(P)-dependent oxidoreductase [Flavobacteriales bacterium]|nr:SDR family NAD(P)-dependent oxidoreductase [Flavobacteriales bacterium]
MKILVTGGAGFIGSHLVDELLGNGHEVVVLDNLANGKEQNLEEASRNSKFQFIKGDIVSMKDCLNAMKGIEVVYHLACLGVRHSIHSPFENHQVNAEGSLNVLEAARKEGIDMFFYISTSEVYGKTNSFPIRETDITMPLTVYGSSKLAGENYAHSYRECYGLNTHVLRIFNNYGPRAHHEGDSGEIIPRSIVKIIYGENPVIFGKGDVTRDFFFVKDTAKVLSAFIETPPVERLMNIGTGVEYTMIELLDALIKLMPTYNAKIDYAEDRPADVPRLWVENKIFKSMNILAEPMSMENGLEETIAYYVELSKERNLLEEIIEKNWIK